MNKKATLLILIAALLLGSCASKRAAAPAAAEVPLSHWDYRTDEGSPQAEAYYHFALSRYHYLHRNFLSSLRELERAVEKDPDSSQLKYILANMYLGLGRVDEARGLLEEAVRLNPDHAPSHALLGKIYAQSREEGMRERAVRELERAVALDEGNVDALLLLGALALDGKKYGRAERYFARAVELAPDEAKPHFFMGRLYLERNELEHAAAEFKKAHDINGYDPTILIHLAVVLERLGKVDESEKLYRTLLALYPASPESYTSYGSFLFRMNRFEEATKLFKEAEVLDRNNPSLKLRLSLLYIEGGEYDKAVEILQQLLMSNPANEKAKYYLALAYIESERFDEAQALLSEFRPGSEFYVDSQIQLSYLQDKRGRRSEALETIRRAYAENPDNERVVNFLGNLLRKYGRDKEAVKLFKRFVRRHPRSETVYYSLAATYYTLGKTEKAIKHMRKVLQINPKNADALNFIGYTYAEQGVHLDEALQLIKEALKIAPNKGYIVDSLGWVYYKRGELEEALKHLLRAASLTPDDPNIMEHVGDVYLKMGNDESALRYYEKGLELETGDDQELRVRLQKKIEKIRGTISRQDATP